MKICKSYVKQLYLRGRRIWRKSLYVSCQKFMVKKISGKSVWRKDCGRIYSRESSPRDLRPSKEPILYDSRVSSRKRLRAKLDEMIMVINSTRFYFNRRSLTFSTLSVPIRPCFSPVPLVIEETRSTFRYGAIMPPLGTLWSNYRGTN